IGRRVDYVHKRYNRNWEEVIGVVLWGRPHTTIDEQEFRVLQALDGRSTAGSVARALDGSGEGASLEVLRRLAARGIVDLGPAAELGASPPEPALASSASA